MIGILGLLIGADMVRMGRELRALRESGVDVGPKLTTEEIMAKVYEKLGEVKMMNNLYGAKYRDKDDE